jgi:hypothetical protein
MQMPICRSFFRYRMMPLVRVRNRQLSDYAHAVFYRCNTFVVALNANTYPERRNYPWSNKFPPRAFRHLITRLEVAVVLAAIPRSFASTFYYAEDLPCLITPRNKHITVEVRGPDGSVQHSFPNTCGWAPSSVGRTSVNQQNFRGRLNYAGWQRFSQDLDYLCIRATVRTDNARCVRALLSQFEGLLDEERCDIQLKARHVEVLVNPVVTNYQMYQHWGCSCMKEMGDLLAQRFRITKAE